MFLAYRCFCFFCLQVLGWALIMPQPVQATGKTHTNSIGMEFVLISSGTFQMGSGENDGEATAAEKPQCQLL